MRAKHARPARAFLHKAKQTYRPDPVNRVAPVGSHSSRRAIAGALWPSTRMLGRAALSGVKPYACLFDVAPDRGCRVSPCGIATCVAQHGVAVPVRTRAGDTPLPQTRLCGPVPRLRL